MELLWDDMTVHINRVSLCLWFCAICVRLRESLLFVCLSVYVCPYQLTL